VREERRCRRIGASEREGRPRAERKKERDCWKRRDPAIIPPARAARTPVGTAAERRKQESEARQRSRQGNGERLLKRMEA
jgi:hypothetical protein